MDLHVLHKPKLLNIKPCFFLHLHYSICLNLYQKKYWISKCLVSSIFFVTIWLIQGSWFNPTSKRLGSQLDALCHHKDDILSRQFYRHRRVSLYSLLVHSIAYKYLLFKMLPKTVIYVLFLFFTFYVQLVHIN